MTKRTLCASLLALLAGTGPAAAQSTPGWGRISLFGQAVRSTRADGTTYSYNEVNASVTVNSVSADDGGVEYRVDLRGATYPAMADRTNRVSIYDAWVGGRLPGGKVGVKVGQMFLTDLGALGSLGGLALEGKAGPLRLGLFGGLEPENFQAGFVKDVRKGGGYVTLDGERGRRHVLGFVTIRNSGLTERNVISVTNFVPVGREFFLYQAGEYDLIGPGGVGSGGLNYIFVTARYSPVTRVDIQGTYQHGRSIDARTITQDLLNGRPVDTRSLQGFLFDSVGGRLTVEVLQGLRVYGGAYRDQGNPGDPVASRYQVGLSAVNLARTGFDLTVSDNRVNRPGSTAFDSWYFSLGRSIGPRLYLTADYSTSLSVVKVTDSGGVTVETRPSSRRYGLSTVANLSRAFSLLLSGELLEDDTSRDVRAMAGLTFRF